MLARESDVPVAMVLRTIQDAYADSGPWEQFLDQLARSAWHRSPLHFALACPPEGRRELESLLVQEGWALNREKAGLYFSAQPLIQQVPETGERARHPGGDVAQAGLV